MPIYLECLSVCIRVRVSGPKFRFFIVRVRIRVTMVCDVTLVCAQLKNMLEIILYPTIIGTDEKRHSS